MDRLARGNWPPPFEPLPADKAALRLRAVRDGLIISGWLATGFCLVVVTSIAHSMGYDAFAYWRIDAANPWALSMNNNFTLGGFRYAPPIALLFMPLGLIPWWLYLLLWQALMLAVVFWLGGRWALVLLALPPVALELYHGNVHLLTAAAIALGFSYPWTWSFVLLTKVTPGIGLVWFVVRREWRNLAIALAATALAAAIATVIAPQYWSQWIDSILSNLNEPQYYSVPPPAPIRIPAAVLLVIWGARTDRPWTVPVAATIGLPIIWPHGLTVALAAVPFLRRGDRAGLTPDWQSAVRMRSFLAHAGVFLGGALALALVFTEPIQRVLENASSNIAPYIRRASGGG